VSRGDDAGGELDVDHLAGLANLPLDEAERGELARACREVLEAFRLPDEEEPEDEAAPLGPVADDARPWPETEVEAIREEFPDRDGRSLST